MDSPNIIREHASLTSAYEKKILLFLSNKMPAKITPDHLTGLGIVAALIIGTAYLFSKNHPWLLWLAVGGWILHWFGDSLDGTVARVRGVERPRYGHFLDHFVDTLVTLYIGAGFAFSGHSQPLIWIFVVVGYYMVSVNSYLSAAVVKRMKLSYGILGPTEARLIFIAFTVFLWLGNPEINLFNRTIRAADVLGFGFIILFFALFVFYGIKTARELDILDKIKEQN